MSEVKVKEETDLWDPGEVENSQMMGSDHQQKHVSQIIKDEEKKDVQMVMESQEGVVLGLDQENTKSLHIIKEDPDLCIKQEEEQLQELPFKIVCVKSGDEDNQQDCSSDPHEEEQTENSTDTEDSADWTDNCQSPANSSSEEMQMRTHTEEKSFACEICNKSFTTKSYLTVHMRIHTGEKPFSCSVCNKGFTRKCHVQQHTKCHSLMEKTPADD